MSTTQQGIAEEINQARIERLERELHQMKKLAAIGQLTCGVVHDFNNLIAIIEMNIEFVLKAIPEDLGAHADLLEIRAVAKRAIGLSRQLLAYSRGTVIAPELLEPNRVISEMVAMLRRLLGNNVAVLVSLDGSLGRVRMEGSQLEQVLLNLVINARDAMPDGGRLTIETRSVSFLEGEHVGLAAASYACISVSDTGIGMDAATSARVFEPFFTTKRAEKGSGLGLSTVRNIVSAAGGAIEVESAPGRGAVFNVYLALAS